MDFKDFLQTYDISLNISDLPSGINGFAYYNGSRYLVVINSRCSNEQQKNTIVHELIHIFENHLTYEKCYEEQCEQEVNYLIKELRTNYSW